MRVARPRAAGREAGVTLLEIMIVLAIIGTLMAVLIGPKLMAMWEESRVKTTRLLVSQYDSAIMFWRTKHAESECPATLEELYAADLVNVAPRDDWGQPLVYRCPARDGTPYELYSTGKDRRDGTDDDLHARPPKPL